MGDKVKTASIRLEKTPDMDWRFGLRGQRRLGTAKKGGHRGLVWKTSVPVTYTVLMSEDKGLKL